jgi:hypothetical protein
LSRGKGRRRGERPRKSKQSKVPATRKERKERGSLHHKWERVYRVSTTHEDDAGAASEAGENRSMPQEIRIIIHKTTGEASAEQNQEVLEMWTRGTHRERVPQPPIFITAGEQQHRRRASQGCWLQAVKLEGGTNSLSPLVTTLQKGGLKQREKVERGYQLMTVEVEVLGTRLEVMVTQGHQSP